MVVQLYISHPLIPHHQCACLLEDQCQMPVLSEAATENPSNLSNLGAPPRCAPHAYQYVKILMRSIVGENGPSIGADTGFMKGGAPYMKRCRRQCIEARSADQSARSAEKFFRLHFSLLKMGSRGTFALFALQVPDVRGLQVPGPP